MAINISLDHRQDVEPETQPIPRTFTGFDPRLSDELLWDANRGAHDIDDSLAQERFATFSHEGTIRLVVELEGVENVGDHGTPRRALLGRVLSAGDPVRDALVGQAVADDVAEVSRIDTTELDSMPAHERYAEPDRPRRTFLLTFDPEQWFWTPEDEESVIAHTAAGASVREVWSAGGRRQGIEPGDRVFLLQKGSGARGVRGIGRVSSRVHQGEHWDDPRRIANHVDVDWDRVLPAEELIEQARLVAEVSGYAWNLQRGGVELHEPMATQMEELWAEHTGERAPEPAPERGWGLDDSRRRTVSGQARARIQQVYEADGWDVVDTHHDRPHAAVAMRGEEQHFLFGKGIETAGRPVLFRVGEVDFIREHPGQCYLGELSDVEFNGTQVVAGSGVLQVSLLDLDANEIEPVLYRYEVPTQRV